MIEGPAPVQLSLRGAIAIAERDCMSSNTFDVGNFVTRFFDIASQLGGLSAKVASDSSISFESAQQATTLDIPERAQSVFRMFLGRLGAIGLVQDRTINIYGAKFELEHNGTQLLVEFNNDLRQPLGFTITRAKPQPLFGDAG